jgi:transcriptional regulator with XRE-family HTH domain
MAKSFDALVAKSASPKVRQRGKTLARKYLATMLLSEVRQRRGLTQKQLADALRIKQPSLSKLESQSDMQLSTLKKIVEALGGRLVVTARFPDGETKLAKLGASLTTSTRRDSRVREFGLVA